MFRDFLSNQLKFLGKRLLDVVGIIGGKYMHFTEENFTVSERVVGSFIRIWQLRLPAVVI